MDWLFFYSLGESPSLMYVQALGIFFLALFFLLFIRGTIIRKLEEVAVGTKTHIDDMILEMFHGVDKYFIVYLVFVLASQRLNLPEAITRLRDVALVILSGIYGTKLFLIFIRYSLRRLFIHGEDAAQEGSVRTLNNFLQYLVWLIAILVVLTFLGFNVSTLVAGLGIGGIAVALAAQNVLGDVLSSISLYLDRPFDVGDFVKIGSDSGTVINIGIRSTRIETFRGQELIISNRELMTSRVQNFRRLKMRSVAFTLTIPYETSMKKLQQVKTIIKKSFEGIKNVEFTRVSLWDFGDSGYVFEVLYDVTSRSYRDYVKVKEKAYFRIATELKKAKITIAYPTHSVHIQKESS